MFNETLHFNVPNLNDHLLVSVVDHHIFDSDSTMGSCNVSISQTGNQTHTLQHARHGTIELVISLIPGAQAQPVVQPLSYPQQQPFPQQQQFFPQQQQQQQFLPQQQQAFPQQQYGVPQQGMLQQTQFTGQPMYNTSNQFMGGSRPMYPQYMTQQTMIPQPMVQPQLTPMPLIQNQVRRFNIRTAFFSFTGGDMMILDEFQQPAFQVVGKWSLTTNFEVRDARSGQTLCRIGQDLITLRDTFRVYNGSVELAKCVKKITFFKDHYVYTRLDKHETLDIHGDFFEYNFNVKRNGQITGEIQKAVWTLRDCYGLSVNPGEDILHHICMVIIIERELEERRQRDSGSMYY